MSISTRGDLFFRKESDAKETVRKCAVAWLGTAQHERPQGQGKRRLRLFQPLLFLLVLLFLFCPLLQNGLERPAWGKEQIVEYKSDLTVEPNGELVVVETITVDAEGDRIRRGIFRDIPTLYHPKESRPYTIPLAVTGVRRNGRDEPWFTENISGGLRIYAGARDALLPPGRHTYEIAYRTSRQLGFFPTHDELYWNVTGNGWEFLILRASAEVHLPSGAEVLSLDAWTGYRGSQEQDFVGKKEGNRASFTTTRPLRLKEGFTIAVAWPKGYVTPPWSGTFFLRDYGMDVALVLTLFLLLLFWSVVWWKRGRDPKPGILVPRFAPPQGFSPASVRFLHRLGYDSKVFACVLLSLASKRLLRIEREGRFHRISRVRPSAAEPETEENPEKEDEAFSDAKHPGRAEETPEKRSKAPRQAEKAKKLWEEERRLLGSLFREEETLLLHPDNAAVISTAAAGLRESLQKRHEGRNFVTNTGWFIAGIVLTVALLILFSLAAFLGGVAHDVIIFGLLGTAWSAGAALLCVALLRTFRNTLHLFRSCGGCRTLVSLLFKGTYALGALLLLLGGFLFTALAVSFVAALAALGLAAALLLFRRLLPARTEKGRKRQDEIKGFALYLETAEEERLKLLHPPERTPELFEALLPYALALDLEVAWSAKFAELLRKAVEEGTYVPLWHDSTATAWMTEDLTRSVSSFGDALASTIAVASVPPGSSSGFSDGDSGGGSSGGGGGGGGGGGW
jgi:uncharacterized membrane protein YgcG